MSTATAEALFATPRLDVVFLSPDQAVEADKAIAGAPTFYKTEFEGEGGEEAPPPEGFTADLLDTPPPPNISKAAVFPLGIREKGKANYIGLSHLILGYPTETTVFMGLLVFAEAFQKKGYGKELLTGIYDWTRPQGIGFVRIRVHPKHEGARAFLDKMGYADLPNKLSTGHLVFERRLPLVED